MQWKTTEWLGGKSGGVWRTGKAKVIPEKLCRALAYSHIKHAETLKCEGNDSIPEHLTEVINALNGLHDPYDENAKDMFMKSDFHKSSMK